MAKSYKDFTVKILGQAWKIKYVESIIDQTTGQLASGKCEMDTLTIWIASGQDHKTTVVTLFHELFHAYVRRSGIYNGMLSFDMEEIICDQFGTVIAENFDIEL